MATTAIILGAIAGYLVYLLLANGLGWGKPIDLSALAAAPWIECRNSRPSFHANAMFLIAPVAIIPGGIRAHQRIGAMTGHSLDAYLGALSRRQSGHDRFRLRRRHGVTTYAENIGVMA
jgi:xanthine/uracil permease